MLLRRARPEELEVVGEVTLAAYADHVAADGDYRHQLADAARRDREAEVWVAVDGDAVLGTVTLCPEGSPWREVSGPGEAEFRMLAVAPPAQGRGVGRALVELALQRADADGCRAVVLCSESGMSPAHRLYDRLGFTRVPDRDWSPVPGIDLLAYRKEL